MCPINIYEYTYTHTNIHIHTYIHGTHILYSRERFGSDPEHRCTKCWLLNHQCICEPVPTHISAAFRHRILVYMHVKEYGRLSNTGALVQVAFPLPQTQVFVADLKEHEERFLEEINKDPVCVCVCVCVCFCVCMCACVCLCVCV